MEGCTEKRSYFMCNEFKIHEQQQQQQQNRMLDYT